MILLQLIFWICLLALLHTYVFYPLILTVLSIGKKNNADIFSPTDDLPYVSVILAAFNEEKIMRQKLDSLLAPQYLGSKLRIFVGSDCSTDATNDIVMAYAQKHSNLTFFPFEKRRGKQSVVNDLVHTACATLGKNERHILVLTDASIILTPQTLFELVKHFKNPAIALVDSNQIPIGSKSAGISASETTYIRSEVRTKHREGVIWQKMLGPLGGCYALRASHFVPIPPNFLVDDFYIAMRTFEKGGAAINEPKAICYESVPHDIREEYRRKRRISAGNFQNLWTFRHLLGRGDALSFVFWSHKVLRWLGPFFIIIMVIVSAIAAQWGSAFFQIALTFEVFGLLILPVADKILSLMNINLSLLRGLRYLLWMNLALLEGFFKFAMGVKSGVWQPTKRE